MLCTEPEPVIGDCYAFVRFSSVVSTSGVGPLNMPLGCEQYRSYGVTSSVVMLSVGYLLLYSLLKKVPVHKQVSVQH